LRLIAVRLIVPVLLISLAGLFLGGVTAWYSIQHAHRIGAINIGPWTAFPFASADQIDPYTIARGVAEGTVPLGATEGLSFEAVTDSQGRALSLACEYRVEGETPPAKLWTLATYDSSGRPVTPAPGGSAAIYSNAVLHFPDGTFMIDVSRYPRPGNWLAMSGSGAFRMVLRIYDTPVTSSAGSERPPMPRIVREECAS
jgi:hypothetical protein